MRRQWKGFVAGILAAMLLVGTIGTAMATVGQRTVNVDYNDIKVTLNGQAVNLVDANGVTVEPFAINGTTYLPVRAVSSALGLDVNWNGQTKTVELSNESATADPGVPTGTYTRNAPAPIGTIQSIQVNTWSEKYNASAVVLEAVRGEKAYQMLKEANPFNSPAKDDMEYIVVKVRVSINSVSEDKAISLSSYSFDAYSSDNVEYQSCFVVDPSPEFGGNVFAGGTAEGYLTVQVKKTDPSPKLVFGADYDGAGGIWFSLV